MWGVAASRPPGPLSPRWALPELLGRAGAREGSVLPWGRPLDRVRGNRILARPQPEAPLLFTEDFCTRLFQGFGLFHTLRGSESHTWPLGWGAAPQ